MLKGIDPILNADVLYALRAMGHGDDLIIADTNFPADSVARQTVLGKLLRIDSVTAGRAAQGDPFGHAARRLRREAGAPHGDRRQAGRGAAGAGRGAEGDRRGRGARPGRWARSSASPSTTSREKAYCVIQTGERRFYGCFVFKKGVIPPDAA